MTPGIRFGVICDGRRLPKWQADAVNQLSNIEGADLVALFIRRAHASRTRPERYLPLSHFLYGLWMQGGHDDEHVSLAEASDGVADIPYDVRDCPDTGLGTADLDPQQIAALDLTFILHLGDEAICAAVVDLPTRGVWVLCQGDPDKYPGGPAGFWEVCHNDPVTRVMLQRLTAKPDERVVLREGWFKALRWSWSRNRDALHYAARRWPALLCRRLLDAQAAFPNGVRRAVPGAKIPGNVQTVRAWLTQARHGLWRWIYSGRFCEKWTIGIADGPIDAFLSKDTRPPIHWLPEPSSHAYYADPFSIPTDAGHTILVEHLDFRNPVGQIHRLQVSDDRKIVSDTHVMPLPVHMSYPSIFEDDGEIYCIPETFQSRAVHLFRVERQSGAMRFVKNLIEDFAAVDPTIIRFGDRYWMFCTNNDDLDTVNLYVWFSDTLSGPWSQHPHNPVKCDVRSTRPAGTPFTRDGRLYRPAQDCSESYGGAISINEVTTLTTTVYHEHTVAVVKPECGRYRYGLHHMSPLGNRTLVDGKRLVFAPGVGRLALGPANPAIRSTLGKHLAMQSDGAARDDDRQPPE